MRDDKKTFIRTLCAVSATMASLCFVGVSIILSVYFDLPEDVSASAREAWLRAANTAIMAVILFACTSLGALMLLFPKIREEKRPPSVIIQRIMKRKRILRIVKFAQRITAAISNWFKENSIGLLWWLFLVSWLCFVIMALFLYSVFHV